MPVMKLDRQSALVLLMGAVALIVALGLSGFLIVSLGRTERPPHGGVIASSLAKQLASADVKSGLRAEVVVPALDGGTIVLAGPYRTAEEAKRDLGLDASEAESFAFFSMARESVMVVLLDRNRHIREYDWVSAYAFVDGGIEQAREGQRIELSMDDEGGRRSIRVLPDVPASEPAGERVKTERELDLEVIENSVKHGDLVDQPRPIEHFAYFRGQSGADKFAVWAKDAGFQIDEVAGRGGGKWVVRFSKVGPLEIEVIEAQRVAATGGAGKFGGMYDGWETGLVRKSK